MLKLLITKTSGKKMIEILNFIFSEEHFWYVFILVFIVVQWRPIKITNKYYSNTSWTKIDE